jgi:hypothetical protein
MNRLLLSIIVVWSSTGLFAAQFYDSIKIVKKDGAVFSYPASMMDSVVCDKSEQELVLSIPRSEVLRFEYPSVVPANEVQLNVGDEPSYFNTLHSITFSQLANERLLHRDFTVYFDKSRKGTLVIPELTGTYSLMAELDTEGTHVFVNGKLSDKKVSLDCSKPIEFKISSFSGKVQTYTLEVRNSGLPVLSIGTVGSITTDWQEGCKFSSTDGNVTFSETIAFRGRGGSFSEERKNNYGIKFESKQSLLGLPKGKRWILISNGDDETLIRCRLALDLYKTYLNTTWSPNVSPCELVIDGKYQGSYLLAEQIRVTDERVPDGYILSIELEEDEDDDVFRSEISKKIFVCQDPEAGSIGVRLFRTKEVVDDFEKLLFSENETDRKSALDMIDLNSFADWFILNEVAKNEKGFDDECYLVITADKKIKMGPIWDLGGYFGNLDSEDVEGWAVKNTPWISRLLNDEAFSNLVYQRFKKIYSSKESVMSLIEQYAGEMKSSLLADEMLHDNLKSTENHSTSVLDSYQGEINILKEWLDARLNWLERSLRP